MRFPLLCLFVVLLLGSAHAAEPFFKKNDVVALVGGEDMVVISDYGYLETLLTRALPDDHLRFRNLAWEGDTVYKQRRDLNFPTWEEQLDKIGATVVICQFGQMESLDGKEKLSEFSTAYEKLLDRLSGGGKRRIVMVSPHFPSSGDSPGPDAVKPFVVAEQAIAKTKGARWIDLFSPFESSTPSFSTRDHVHLDGHGQFEFARHVVTSLGIAPPKEVADTHADLVAPPSDSQSGKLNQLIVAKNKLWFDYWRPENWAFLAGDRTNQPSSRDWRDPSKRWFPAEREEFIPLVQAKEKEIDALAEKLAGK